MLATLRRVPLLATAFLLAAAAALVFAVNVIWGVLYWQVHESEPVEPWMTVGYIGRSWDLSPREMLVITDLATTYLMVRRAADAEATMRRALQVEPDNALAMGELSDIILYRTGDIAAALTKAVGEEIDRRRVVLADPLRTVGEHKVVVHLVGRLRPTVTVVVAGELEDGTPIDAVPAATSGEAAPDGDAAAVEAEAEADADVRVGVAAEAAEDAETAAEEDA